AHWQEASAAMQDAVMQAARAAEKSGARLKDLELPPIFAEAVRAHPIIQGYEAFRALAFEYERHRDQLGPLLRRQLDEAAAINTRPAAPRVARVRRGPISSPTARRS